MASIERSLGLCVVMSFLLSAATSQSPKTNPVDVQVLHELMYAMNYEIDWAQQVPDPCVSSPQGIFCEADEESGVLFVTELQFGFISPLANIIPCAANASIPESIGKFTRLRSLSFRRCFTNQSVTLPDELFDLGKSLQVLSFRGNPALTGALPARVASLTGLQRLTLSENSLHGAIPESIAELSSLAQLDLSHNAFSGPVPAMAMASLVNLDLRYNALEAFPVLSAPRMQRLALSHNRLRGALLPDSFAGVDALTFLDLSFNEFSGALPASLRRLARLEDLFLNGNFFESVIPEGLSELKSLVRLDLSSCKFVGAIPGALERLEQLRFLSVSNNRLSGPIPSELAALPVLFTLDLHANALSGPVPFAAPFVQRMGQNLLLRENAGLCYGPQLVATVKVLLADLKQCPESSILTTPPPPPPGNAETGSSRVPSAAPALHHLPASSISRIIVAASTLCLFLSRT